MVGVSVVVGLAPSVVHAEEAGIYKWNGVWKTEWGDLTLAQSDAGVDGTYPHDGGHVAGTLATPTVLKARWDEAPRKTDEDRGTVTFSMAKDGKHIIGRWSYDKDPAALKSNWTGTCKSGECLKNGPLVWPALPDALVELDTVANGCGGGAAGNDPKLGDESVISDSEMPFEDVTTKKAKKFPINYREACKQHDAGYSGAKVKDLVNGGTVTDYFDKNQKWIDNKFYDDMVKICDAKIPAKHAVALNNCKFNGGFHTVSGAKTRWNIVFVGGYFFYKERPALTGAWTIEGVPGAGTYTIRQEARSVTATWDGGESSPDLRGEFRGTLISHDDTSTIEGFFVLSDKGVPRAQPAAMTWTWSTAAKNRIVAGPITLRR